MNIAYTINGEGMGHASRSSVVIDHLLSRGHRVMIFSSGRKPASFLNHRFGAVAEVTGLHMVYYDNKVRRFQTAVSVLRNATGIRRDLKQMQEILADRRPDVVITDFDFHGEIIARSYHIPLISIDNIQYITQAKFRVAPEDLIDYELNYAVAKMLVPRADYYLISVFDSPELRSLKKKDTVFFVPPLIRKKIIDAKPKRGEHILVYQTSDSYTQLFSVLMQSSEQFIVYNAKYKTPVKNVICKEFNEDSFVQDLATSKAVIVNGGYNVITESLYLKKPILTIPIKNFFEQKLNGLMLQKLGYGVMVKRLSKSVLTDFVARLSQFEGNLATVSFDPSVTLQKLDEILIRLSAAQDARDPQSLARPRLE